MKLSGPTIRDYCRRQGRSLSSLLRDAGVSRTAYYSLARKDSVVPRSVLAIARELGVDVQELLVDADAPTRAEIDDTIAAAHRIVERNPGTSFENVWHTLMLLREPPHVRLDSSLRRGRAVAVHR